MAMLEISDLHTYYGNIHALKGISLTVEQGEIVTLIGANGAGKTTTLKAISGLLKPRAGKICLEHEDLLPLKAHQIVYKGVVMVPEGRGIFARLTVAENLDLGAYSRTAVNTLADDQERVFTIFPRLKERQKQVAGTLSGGEQQMLAIGRALMAHPRLMLLGEQTALVALSIAHRGYVIQTGEIVLADTAASLEANEMVRKSYLGIEE